MRIAASRLLPVALLLLATRTHRLEAQQHEAPANHTATRDSLVYSSNAADFIVGKRVYLRSTKTYIGTISAVDPDKRMGPHFPRRRMKAVLIDRAEQRHDWVPVEGITRIYVTR